jgi:hypothetical protein
MTTRKRKALEAQSPTAISVPDSKAPFETLSREEKIAEVTRLVEEVRLATLQGPRFRIGSKGEAHHTMNQLDSFDALAVATGTRDVEAAEKLLCQVACAVSGQTYVDRLNHVSASMAALAPTDPLEGLLVGQMVACHNAALRFLSGAMCEENERPQINEFTERAVKLMRTFTAQTEALARLRGKGSSEQRVVVQHVHVNEGGQAIVGSVTKGSGGEGAK